MMKLVCLGQKNYLFCGSEKAVKNTSLIYSIIETCKMSGLRPVKYVADVFKKTHWWRNGLCVTFTYEYYKII